jgi:hypothetical protein
MMALTRAYHKMHTIYIINLLFCSRRWTCSSAAALRCDLGAATRVVFTSAVQLNPTVGAMLFPVGVILIMLPVSIADSLGLVPWMGTTQAAMPGLANCSPQSDWRFRVQWVRSTLPANPALLRL